METALEENRRLNAERVEAVFRKAYALNRHPLLLMIQESSTDSSSDSNISNSVVNQKLIAVGTKMVVS